MIRARIVTDTQPLDNLKNFVTGLEGINQDLLSETYLEVSGNFLDELVFYPPKLPNQRYVRTFQLRRGMIVFHEENQIIVQNKAHPGRLKYVIGTFDRRKAGKQQADIHKGRWPLIADTVAFWFDAIEEIFAKKFETYLSAVGTSTTRRVNR